MAESFGRYLQRERRMRDVPLERIAQITKINLSMLEALENDRLEDLPSPAIVKGFLRAYAQVLGLAGGALVLRYESLLESLPHDRGSARRAAALKPRRLGPLGWILFLILALGVGLHLRDLRRADSPREETAPEARAPETIVYRKNYLRDLETSAAPGTPPRVAVGYPDPLGPPGEGLNLRLEAEAPARLRVILDSGHAETIALAPGQTVVRHAFRGAVIETEHPEWVSVGVNGRDVPFFLSRSGAGRLVLDAGEGPIPEDPAPVPSPPSTPLPDLSLPD
jgi:cytoskeleton protein RodZ